MLRACLVDMGGVLLSFSHERMCRQMAEVCGVSTDAMRRLVMHSGLQADFESGLPASEYHRRIEDAIDTVVDRDSLLEAHCDIFELNAPVARLIEGLAAAGVRLVLLSNTDASHFEFVRRRFEVLDRFDDFVLSYRIGTMKPGDAIYRAALQAIGCRPGECFYTDDIADYVAAGRRWGLPAEQFTDAASLAAHFGQRGVRLDLS